MNITAQESTPPSAHYNPGMDARANPKYVFLMTIYRALMMIAAGLKDYAETLKSENS